MAKIQTLKNKDDVIIYPQTHGAAVFVNEGELLQDKIESYLVSEEVGEVEDVNVTAELTSNKVISIGDTSTDLQYPSAKAVYDFVENQMENVNIDLSDYATKTEIPTQTSQLENNSGFITTIPEEYITETKLNSKGYITDFSEIDPTVPEHVKNITQDDITNWNNKAENSNIPIITSGTEDLEAGVSSLANGAIHVIYE